MTALQRAIAQPDPVHGFGIRSPLDGLDRRSVGFADVLAQSVAAVAPTAAATTNVLLIVTSLTNGPVVLSTLAAALFAMLTAVTINQFAKRMAATGSLYTFVSKGLGSGAAMATAASILVGYGFVAVFALLGGANYLQLIGQRLWPSFAGSGVVAGLAAALAIVLTAVLVRGIRISTRVALVVEGVSVAILLGLLCYLVWQIGPLDWAAVVPPGGVDAAALGAGAVLAFTGFVGFESSATLGVEARSPLRNIPRAIVGTVAGTGALYVLAAYTQVAGFSALGRDLADSRTPVHDLAEAHALGNIGVVVDIGIAASFLACAVASTTALIRVLFSMGREGIVSPRLGRTHPRLRIPSAATAVAVALVTVVPLIVAACAPVLWDAMRVVLCVSAVGYVVAYALVCAAAPLFLRRIGELTFWPAAGAVLAAVGLAVGLVIYLVVESSRSNAGVWLSLALAAGASVLIGWRLSHPVPAIGTYDEPTASEVLGGVAGDREPGQRKPEPGL